MTEVVFSLDKKGNYSAVKAEGHADFDEEGLDIVCASVSALVQTALLALIEIIGLKDIYYIKKESLLEFVIPIKITSKQKQQIKFCLDMIQLGLNEISRKFPQNLKVIVVNT